jgi:hypothetical protein
VRTVLFVLLVCAAADLLACAVLVAVVWAEYRRVRREAAAAGTPVPSAAGSFGCLLLFGLLGIGLLYGSAWLLLTE